MKKLFILFIFFISNFVSAQNNFIYEFNYSDTNCSSNYSAKENDYKNGYRIISPRFFFNSIEFYVDESMGVEWKVYAQKAAFYINNIGSSLNVKIVNNLTEKSSVISYNYELGNCVAAAALPPYQGKIGRLIYINPETNNLLTHEKIGILVHEMLHTVGFKHAGSTDGIMLSGSDQKSLWEKSNDYRPIMLLNTGSYELTILDKLFIKKAFYK